MSYLEKVKLLIVDDEPDISHLLKDILEDEGYLVNTAKNAKEADEIYQQQMIDLVLLDIWMPDEDGISLLKRWSKETLKSQVVMMSGHGTIETAVEATKLGAYDFLEKPVSIAKLLIIVQNVLKKASLEKKNAELIKQLNPTIKVIGKSPEIKEITSKIKQISQTNIPVLFTGSPGSGKSFYVRFLHQITNRNDKPLIIANASALSHENQVVELFGNEDQGGLLSTADGGILYIDEIINLTTESQAILSQLLEYGEYKRYGNDRLIKPNVRFCFGTNYNLIELENKIINQNLFSKIKTMIIEVPELNQYNDDIPELINYFVFYFVDHEKLTYHKFSMQALNYLRQYSWPGNIRELRNFVQRSLVLAQNEEITLEEAKKLLNVSNKRSNKKLEDMISIDVSIREAREQFEKSYFLKQLEFCDGNIAKLADRAGMERTNLYRKLKTLGIDYK